LRLRLPTPGLVGSPHVHSSCLVPVILAGFLIKCLHVHWQSLPQCHFAWPFSRRVGCCSRGLLLPVSPLPLCQFFLSAAAAHLRCDTRHGYPSPFAGPYLPVGCRPLHSPCHALSPKRAQKKPWQGKQNTMLSSKAIKKISLVFLGPFWGQGVMYFFVGTSPQYFPCLAPPCSLLWLWCISLRRRS
jgi:hypothetical protein